MGQGSTDAESRAGPGSEVRQAVTNSRWKMIGASGEVRSKSWESQKRTPVTSLGTWNQWGCDLHSYRLCRIGEGETKPAGRGGGAEGSKP